MLAARPRRIRPAPMALLLGGLLAATAAGADPPRPAWRPVGSLNGGPRGFAIVDAARDRLVLLVPDGADDMVGAWEVPLDGPPDLREIEVDGLPPIRIDAPVLDPARQRILFIDPAPGGPFQVGALELSPRMRWTTLATSGERGHGYAGGHLAILDPIRDELVLYRSEGTYPVAAELMRLDLRTNVWRRAVVAGAEPPGRHLAVAAYDSRRRRMILHGGEDYFHLEPVRRDLWALSLADTVAWTPLETDGPGALPYADHLGVYDADGDRLIVFGGEGGHDDVRAYGFETGTWQRLAPSTVAPGGRARPYYALDPAHRRILMGGGRVGTGAADLDLWALTLAGEPVWMRVLEPDPVTVPRTGNASAWDSGSDRVLVWGGRTTTYAGNDLHTGYTTGLWALSFGARPRWTELTPPGPAPPPRQLATLAYDETGDAAWLFGGTLTTPWLHFGVTYTTPTAWYGDVWRLDLGDRPHWTPVIPENDGPSGREGHATALDPLTRRLLIYGGRDSLTPALGDLWALAIDPPCRWTRILPGGFMPAARADPVLVLDPGRRRLILTGGRAADGTSLEDTWTLALDAPAGWEPLATRGSPPRTRGPRPGVWDAARSRVIVFGEGDAAAPAPAQRAWALDLEPSPEWRELGVGGPPQRDRAAASAVFDPVHDQAVLLGGATGAGLEEPVARAARLAFGATAPSATVVTFLEAVAEPGRVRLAWTVTAGPGFRAQLDRREEGLVWRTLAEVRPDGDGRLGFEDASVEAGHRYAYRIAWRDDAGWGIGAEQWIAVPFPARFALDPPRPNPARGRLELTFALPDRSPARLELVDVTGRVVMRRALTAPDAGTRIEPIDVSRLPAGIYLVRLSHRGAVLQRRAIVLPPSVRG